MSVYSEIKKYLLYLVGFFCVLLSAHIVVLYLYNDATTFPLKGGTLNIGIVSKKPALDILAADTKLDNNSNDTALHFLYRSLLRYSVREKKIVGDLTTCGLDTFPTIRCTIGQDALWSDGTAVGVDDIISTYAFFKDNARNETTKSRLALLDVFEDKGDAVFRFKTNDATVIDTLFLPILNKKNIAHFDTNGMETSLFSGPYVFDSIDADKWTFLFKQNPYFKNADMTQYFDQIRFGFWETRQALDDTIDADIILSDNDADKKNAAYVRPLIYGIFLNSAQVPNTLRTAIFNDIFSSLDVTGIDEKKFKKEENVFFWEVPTSPRKAIEGLFPKAANNLGYFFGGSTPPPAPVKVESANAEKPLTYINRPWKVTPLFVSSETVEIGGSVPRGTTRVVINDYGLQSFVPSRKQFLYNARKDYKNLVDGINTYKVIFFNGKKILAQESVVIYYNANTKELALLKDDWKKANEPQKPTEPVTPPPSNLDTHKLYKDGKELTMTIVIQNEIPFFPQIAEQIQEKLTALGVTTHIVALPISEIKKSLQNPEFSYDIVLTGINLGLFHYNILPFFHSGQVKWGYNISRTRNSTLDSIMERMTEQLYFGSPDKLRNYENNAEKILEQEAVFYPLVSPYEYIIAKDTVLWLSVPEFIPGRELLVEILSKSYFKQGYKRSEEQKTFPGFFVWLKNELFSHL